MNRIKEARKRKNISQKELAEKLNVTQQAVSYYENGSRLPDEKTWSEISNILTVPVDYLTGKTDDPDGWDIWEKNTGFSAEEIKNEIERMKIAQHILGDPNNLQNLIGQAVANLDGKGNTDRGIIDSIAFQIARLQDELSSKYKDPQKIQKLPSIGESKIRKGAIKDLDIFFDDLNVEAYSRAIEVLIKARKDLQKISNDLRLK